jgi:hypothetical protein
VNKDTNWKRLQEVFKQLMKDQLKGTVEKSFREHGTELIALVQEATDRIATSAFDETRMEEIARYARDGATYVALRQLIKQVSQDATDAAYPVINDFIETIKKLLLSATAEAVEELIITKLLRDEQTKSMD